MPTPMELLATANADVARLTGIETQFNSLLAQIPGGNVASLTTLLAEHGRFRDEVTRLTGEVTTLTTRATTAEGEVSRLTSEMETVRAGVTEQAENRAAEIVAETGNQAPAAAETSAGTVSSQPANSETFYAEYDRLHAQDPGKAADYWRTWRDKI